VWTKLIFLLLLWTPVAPCAQPIRGESWQRLFFAGSVLVVRSACPAQPRRPHRWAAFTRALTTIPVDGEKTSIAEDLMDKTHQGSPG
jgi:hypothetical protein